MTGREFVKRFGIKRFHDVGRDVGISHVIVTDRAYALPGTVLALRGFAHLRGRRLELRGARRRRAGDDLRGDDRQDLVPRRRDHPLRSRPAGCSPASPPRTCSCRSRSEFGEHTNQNMEFGGPALAHLSLNARRTIATQAAEVGAEFAIFEADDVLLDYVRARTTAPFEAQHPDAGRRLCRPPHHRSRHDRAAGRAAGFGREQRGAGRRGRRRADRPGLHRLVRQRHARRSRDRGARRRGPAGGAGRALHRDAGLAGRLSRGAAGRLRRDAGARPARSSPTRPAAPAAAGTWACSGRARPASPRARATSRAAWAIRPRASIMASPATVAASALTGVITHPGEFIGEATA